MPIEAGATYVFDLGYYDYAWWAKLDAAGCRIVTRFKSNTRLAVTAELDAPEGRTLLAFLILVGHGSGSSVWFTVVQSTVQVLASWTRYRY